MPMARHRIDKDLPTFSSNVKEWSNFVNQFNTTKKLLGLSDVKNICCLRNCLKGDAKRSVEGLLVSGTSVAQIIQIIETDLEDVK